MATLALEVPQECGQAGEIQPYWQPKIEGCYRPITVHQLAMYWWLYAESKITARQLRIVFALHEMHERRSFGDSDAHRRYTVKELRQLIGGGGESDAALTRDIGRLCRLGVITFESNRLTFATRVGQLSSKLDLESFWTLFNQLDHPKRTVPVPRRVLRALAGGFSRAVMGTLIAHLIRCLFWHKGGGYRVDGRTKASWVVDLFGISRASVLAARKKLVELGWLEKLPAEQWELNRWGGRFAICTAGPNVEFVAESGPPLAANESIPGPLCKQISSPKGEAKETRKPTSGGPSGVSLETDSGSRKRKANEDPNVEKPPTIFDIQKIDLEEPTRTEALYQDAVKRGKASPSQHGRMQFWALAERAKARGHDPARLLAWLLRENKTEFIAQIDEERSLERIKRLDYGIIPHSERKKTSTQAGRRSPAAPSNDVRIYGAVMDSVRKNSDATSLEQVAQAVQERYGWTKERWEQAGANYWNWRQGKAEVDADEVAALDAVRLIGK